MKRSLAHNTNGLILRRKKMKLVFPPSSVNYFPSRQLKNVLCRGQSLSQFRVSFEPVVVENDICLRTSGDKKLVHFAGKLASFLRVRVCQKEAVPWQIPDRNCEFHMHFMKWSRLLLNVWQVFVQPGGRQMFCRRIRLNSLNSTLLWQRRSVTKRRGFAIWSQWWRRTIPSVNLTGRKI